MKTSELAGVLLDYWVARAEGFKEVLLSHYTDTSGVRFETKCVCFVTLTAFNPSINWTQGGPIIERELIQPYHRDEDGSDNVWHAVCPMTGGYEATEDGPTLLIAAMRAYVASKYGDEVPDEQDLP